MNRKRTYALSLILFVLAAGVAQASWYDDYDAGIAAARKGNWSTVVQKMSAAIKGNAKESNSARTYGAIFINYHPYYYRGIANLNLGNYEQAISDLEKTQGPGEVDLGPIGAHLERAKTKLAQANEPEPAPTRPEPVRPAPAPVQPAAPAIDPGLRQRASNAIAAAKQKLQAAERRRATGSQPYVQAMSLITDATVKNASPKNNDDLNAIIGLAESAADLADLAAAPAVATPAAPGITPKPVAATTTILADAQAQVRRALEYYFAGEFNESTKRFRTISQSMPNNGWIWAFLGASQYSQYAFEADETYRRQALESFQKAKKLGKWGKSGLPEKYFSKRIRKAFNET
ncbi:MAG TPA: hypothetical protein VNA69_05790 [Thermoanaerobaculia bacterium]|nr:hypothetical protein [Thermoanaerobaculia bacterium]